MALAEVSESDARGRVSDLYADIRETLQVPIVNTIYRRLAVMPEALEWAWHSIRPHIVSGAIPHQAERLRRDVALSLQCTGIFNHPASFDLPPESTRCALEVVRAYDAANRLNLIAFTHLLNAPHHRPRSRQSPVDEPLPGQIAATKSSAVHSTALMAMPLLDELPPEVGACVRRLNRHGEVAEPKSFAGLYLHLAHWPGLLAAFEQWLLPWENNGVVQRTRATVTTSVLGLVSAQGLPMTAPSPEVEACCIGTLQTFCRTTIPKMVPTALLLRHALEGQAVGFKNVDFHMG